MVENATIIFKLSDMFWLAAGIGAVIAAWKGIKSINPLHTLSAKVDVHEELLKKDLQHLERHDQEIRDLESHSQEDRKIMIQCMQGIINYLITDDKDKLIATSDNLNEYLAGTK